MHKTALDLGLLQKISVSMSLIILSLGVFFLGLLSFFNEPHVDLANVPCVDSASWIAGNSASFFAGSTFLVASCVYWRRYPGHKFKAANADGPLGDRTLPALHDSFRAKKCATSLPLTAGRSEAAPGQDQGTVEIS